MDVKVGGMCCVISTGTFNCGAMAVITATRACGPPVDDPMTRICGGNKAGLRSWIAARAGTLASSVAADA